MATNRFAVEGLMDEMDLKYFSREDDTGCSWMLAFNNGVVLIRLIEQGEFLLVRSLALAKLDRLTSEQQANLLRQLLRRNDQIKLGHYSVADEVVFESSLPIEDAELTANQFKRCVGVVIGELNLFESSFEDLCRGVVPSEDAMDQLMRRLLDGPSAQLEPVQECEAAPSHAVAELKTQDNLVSFSVVLKSFASSKVSVVKVVRQLTGMSLVDSKRLVESAPAVVGRFDSRDQAVAALQQLADAGAIAAIE